MLQTVGEWIWWERLWLPVSVSWSDLEDKEGRVYAKASQLYATLPCALCLLVIRYLFERYLATPLANIWGIRDRIRLPAEQNPILEKYFCGQTRIPTQDDVRSLCKKTGWPERRVEVWFKRRRNQERPGLRKRFNEASWRCAFYFFAFVGGILALYDKPWVYNLREVWAGFPKQSLLPSQYWYYLFEMGFYLSLVFSLTFDVKRKDFKEQVIHHMATLTLLSFSWISNYIRIGTLVMVLHDSSDILLEYCLTFNHERWLEHNIELIQRCIRLPAEDNQGSVTTDTFETICRAHQYIGAKVLNYAKYHRTANGIFVVFTAVFMVTRLIIFPFWLIHCTWVYPLELFPPFFGYYFFNIMLLVLLLLHLYWAVLISRMVYKFIFSQLEGDDRSDEEEDDSDPPKEINKLSHMNGSGARGRANGH